MLKESMSPKEVAEVFGVSLSTVYYWIINSSFFNVRKVGCRYRIARTDVEHLKRHGFPLDGEPVKPSRQRKQ